MGHVGDTAIESIDAAGLAHFIRNNFVLGPVPTVPEILLHTAGPRSGMLRLAERYEHFRTPYWAYLWGGGLALARYLLDHPHVVEGRRVLDLGTGSGIVGIASAKVGASQIIASDVDPYAIVGSSVNAKANGAELLPLLGDLTAGPPPQVDVVLVGDLFYDAVLAARVTAFLDRCLGAGMAVLIGDPYRAHLPTTRLDAIANYPGPDFAGFASNAGRLNSVFQFLTETHAEGR
ncbi:class I SAM-dependent methyltransferase [Rhizobium johnstonii]|uniref:class I SAM-dependent methyltransferase n=1 Tax=Rhizobium johnstonii TaxID=3019933 RepID=UPI003F9C4669